MKFLSTTVLLLSVLITSCGGENKEPNDKPSTEEDTTAVSSEDIDNIEKTQEAEPKEEKTQKTKAEYQYILGKWNGTLRDKKLTIVIESIQGNDVVGYNIAGKNKRPLTGKISADDRNGDGECMGNMIVYKLLLNEPGDDKWDGTYTLYFGDCPEYDEETDKILSHGYSVYGSWRAFSGKLSGDVYLTK
jgi:hypothetical protein